MPTYAGNISATLRATVDTAATNPLGTTSSYVGLNPVALAVAGPTNHLIGQPSATVTTVQGRVT